MASGDGRSEWVECKKRDGSHACVLCENESGWCSFNRIDPNVVHCQNQRGQDIPGWELVKISEHGGGAVYRRAGTQRERLDPSAERARRDAEAAERAARDAEKIAFARKVAAKARGTSDHPRLRAYFASRGVDLASLPGGIVPRAVRFSASQPFKYTPKSGNDVDLAPGPAALCMTLDEHDQHVGMQRIYLDPDGDGKRPRGMCLPAGVDDPKGGDPKKTLGVVAASACRLGGCQSPHAAGDAAELGRVVLLACEGIETGVAILAAVNAWAATLAAEHPLAGVRFEVWACVSTSGLRSIRLRAATVARGGYAAVLVMADHDRFKPNEKHRPGASAAVMAVQKITKEYGVPAAVVLPTMADAPELVGPAPSVVDGYGEILSDEKSVDWLDVYNLAGGWARVAARVINVSMSLVESVPAVGKGVNRRESAGKSVNGGGLSARGRGTDEGSGGGDGGAPLEGEVLWDGKSPIEILPSIRVRRARLALARLFAPGSFEGGAKSAAGERFTLCYHVPTQTWLRYNGLHYVKVSVEVLRAHLVRFFHPFWVWTGDGLKAQRARVRKVAAKRAEAAKRSEEHDGLDDAAAALVDDFDAQMAVAKAPAQGDIRPSDLSSSAIDDIINAMHIEASVHHAMLPVWSPPTFDDRGSPIWGTAAWPDETVDKQNPRERPLFTAYRNGVLEIAALKEATPRVVMRPHSSRFISPNCLPYELPADAIARVLREDPKLDNMGWSLITEHAPNFAAFIKHAANGDEIWENELQKAVGLLQASDVKFQKIIHFLGTIGSGKSTLADVLCAMLGEKNVGYMSLKDFTEKFLRATMIDKLMLYVDEAKIGHSTDAVEVSAWVQRISSGVGFQADMKNRDIRESVYSSATMLWTANEMPRFPDGAAALSRRLLVFPFPDGEEQRKRRGVPNDPDLKSKMLAEVPWIAAWGLVGLVRLYREGVFRQPRDGVQHVEEYKRQASQGHAFFCDCLVDEPNSMVSVAMLNAIYRGHALSRSIGVLGQDALQSQLRTIVPGMKRDRVTDRFGTRRYVYKGIRPKLTTDEDVGEDGKPVVGYKYEPHEIVAPADAYRVAEFEFKWRDKNWGGDDDLERPGKDDGQQHLATA